MKAQNPDLAPLLACPRCGAPLAGAPAALACTGCAAGIPLLGKLPVLFADPDAKLWEWRNLHALAIAEMERDEERHKNAAKGPALTPTTARRLRTVLQAKVEYRKAIAQLLEPLHAAPVAAIDAFRLLMGKSSASQTLIGYVTNVFRDWGWPETTENAAALRLVRAALPAGAKPRRLLVLGGGACRLPYDLHQALSAESTVVCDINPLYLLLAARLADGKRASLHEFPLAPDGLDNAAVLRRLEAPAAAGEGFHLVLADAMDPPFAAGAFDLVLTPWFLDIVPQDTRFLAPKINRLLAPGGTWVNFGSAVFQRAEPERCLSREELLEVVAGAGFTVGHQSLELIDYLASPASCQARREKVLTFGAQKTAEAPAAERFRLLPDWLTDPGKPIPHLPAFADHVRAQMMFAAIVQLADGKNSANDIAAIVGDSLKVAKEQTLPMVVRFLAGLYEGR